MRPPAVDPDLDRLRAAIAEFSQAQEAAFDAGQPVATLLAERASAFDGWLRAVWNQTLNEAADSDQVALFAVGGYGRAELHPHSDLDVLIVLAQPPNQSLRAGIERFVSTLWDLNLHPGHAVRTPAQCTQAAVDLTVCTALMEARRLAGATEWSAILARAIAPDQVWPVPEYVQAKLDAVRQRHARLGDTSYNLEPNLKEGPGGLRDIHTLAWIARRVTGSGNPDSWLQSGLIRPRQWRQLTEARDHLARLRFGLHLLANRAEERLLFDHQLALADRFGLRDRHRDNRAVEQLMQGYFRTALGVRRQFSLIAARWRERADGELPAQPLAEGFLRRGNRIAFADPHALNEQPSMAVRLFACWQQHTDLTDLESASAAALDAFLESTPAELAADAQARAAFLDVLRGPQVAHTLERMHLHGVLGAYLPAFAQVSGRMQYDLFHVYTVDQHTLRVIGHLDRFAADQAPEFPRAGDVFGNLRKPKLLFLAALFHDIAKGRGGDHSELGGEDAARFCAAHDLSAADTDLVVWLVRQHLLLSVTAQKSDITDPDIIQGFAAKVADRERLDALYLLTMADIAGTAPTLWNAWKARLMADLYTAARFAMRRGLEHPIHVGERIDECRHTALDLLERDDIQAQVATAIWEDFPSASFLRYRPQQVAWLTRQIANADPQSLPLVAVRDEEGGRGALEIFVHSPDIDGLFGAITAALDRLDLAVVEARIFTSRKGLSLDTFRVLERTRRDADPHRADEIARSLRHALRQRPLRFGPVRRSLSRPQRHFQMTPQIEITPSSTQQRTRMTLVCSDRPGLLALVAQVLREQGVRVHGARIATFGERAEDFFLLSNERDQPLDEAATARVEAALLDRLRHTFGDGHG